jgi:glucose/arabinose dehydrogenase
VIRTIFEDQEGHLVNMPLSRLLTLVVVGGVMLVGDAAAAQNPDAAQIPTGRTGRGGYPLPTLPAVFETFQHNVRVSVVARGLDRPWSLLILPDGDMLVSLRYSNEIRAIRRGGLDPTPVGGLPEMQRLFDLVLHPNFDENGLIYFDYARAVGEGSVMVLARGRYEGTALTNVEELYVSGPSTQGASRMAFAPDGTIYITVSGAFGRRGGFDPRTLDNVTGKVLRLRDDGTVPSDNPFVGTPGALPEIFSYGHRDHFGIAPHPVTGEMFHVELGPYGGDKVNILRAGGDYGWPDYGYGRNNDSSPMGNPNTPGIEPALLVWLPGITPSGLLFYTGDRFPAWTGNLMVGSTVRGRTNGASGVERVVFNDMMWETRRETFLSELKQRIRDVRQGPDGLIYVLTEEVDGAVLRIEPAN